MPPAAGARDEAGARTLALITAGIFGMVTSVTMIGPLLVDISRAFDVSIGQAGLLAAVAAVPQAIGSPFAGLLSDRFGRRPMIVLALGSVGATGLVASVAPNFAALVFVRFLAGLLGSCGPTSLMASVGDLFPPERRARAMGWFNMGFGLAAIAGVPAIAAVDGVFGWRAAFAVSGVILLAIAVALRLWFPTRAATAAGTSVFATYRAVWSVPQLGHVLGANLAERSMFIMVTIYVPAFFMLTYGMSATDVAPILSIVAIGAIVGNLLGGWLGDHFLKPRVFLAAQLVAGALALALFGSPLGLAVAAALAALFGLANAAGRPPFLAFSSDLAPRHRGALFGLLAFTNQSGLVIGSALGGLVIELGSYRGLAVVAAAQACLAAALALTLRPRPITAPAS